MLETKPSQQVEHRRGPTYIYLKKSKPSSMTISIHLKNKARSRIQSIPQRETRRRLQIPATRPSMAARDTVASVARSRRSSCSSVASSSPRPRPAGCTCSNHPGSTRCSRHGYLVPKERSKNGNKEIIRRALAPTNRRLSLRWWNFRPTPSRLSNMSKA